VDEGPIPAVHGVVCWRACDLIMRLHEEFGLSVSDDTVYRALKQLGFSHVSARPRAHKQDAEVMEAFKKTLPHAWRKSVRSSLLARVFLPKQVRQRWNDVRCATNLSGYFLDLWTTFILGSFRSYWVHFQISILAP